MNRVALVLLSILLTSCASVSDQRPEAVRKSEYFIEHGVSAFGNSDYVTASNFFRKALAHYRSIDDRHGVLLSHLNLAETAHASGNFDAAVKNLDAAQQIAQQESLPHYQQRLLLLRAQVHWRQRQRDASLALLQKLLPEFDEAGNTSQRPSLLILSATTLRTDIAFKQNDNAEANLWLHRLERLFPRVSGDTLLQRARLERFRAQKAARAGHVEDAIQRIHSALKYYRQAAARPAIAATLTEIGRLHMQQQQWQKAEESLQRALYIRLWIMDRIGSHQILLQLADLYKKTGHTVRAEEVRTQADAIHSAPGKAWLQLRQKRIGHAISNTERSHSGDN